MNAKKIGINLASGGAWIFALCCCAILLAGFGGCASDPAWLTFTSGNEQQFAQKFSRATFSSTADGQYDVVLMDQPAAVPTQPAALPTGQTIHIHVHTSPGGVAENPALNNATLDWFVTSGNDPARRLHYHGSGSVSLSGSGDDARVIIHAARLELTSPASRWVDLPEESSLTGSFRAIRDDSGVSGVIAAIRAEMMRTQPTEASAHEGPPPRGPTGP